MSRMLSEENWTKGWFGSSFQSIGIKALCVLMGLDVTYLCSVLQLENNTLTSSKQTTASVWPLNSIVH